MCGAGMGRGGGSVEHYSVVEKQGAVVRRSPGSIYENFLKASRSKAVSRRRCSSVRWVFLLPVAGAAAGSRPAYLRGATVRGDGEGPRGARAPLPSPGPSRLPATLPHRLGAVDGGPQPGLHVVVVALVLVLLLAPGQLGAGVLLHLLQQEVEGEGRQLGRERGAPVRRRCSEYWARLVS